MADPEPAAPVARPAKQAGWRQGSAPLPSFYSPRSLQPPVGEGDGAEIDPLSLSPKPIDTEPTILPPPSFLSPAPTPGASTPATSIPRLAPETTTTTPPPDPVLAASKASRGIPVDSSLPAGGGCGNKKPRLLDSLPEVKCVVRARIPTVAGAEIFLHLYANDVDTKEHLAIVFGPHIRSRSLDSVWPGETEMDRMVRGAYTGRLYPGRTTSGLTVVRQDQNRVQELEQERKQEREWEQEQERDRERQRERRDRGRKRQDQEQEQERERVRALDLDLNLDLDQDRNQDRDQDQTMSAPSPSSSQQPPLVRIHSECYTGETAWSARCDCGEQLDEAARLMSLPENSEAGGIIVYLRQEGRGIGLGEKLKAYNLQDLGSDTVEANLLLRHPADARSYGLATAMLKDLGQTDIRLLTNNPDKIRAVEGPGREVVVRERVAMVPLSWRQGEGEGIRGKEVEEYLKTKVLKMGHLIQLDDFKHQ